jgi:Amt family ammonium transporter
VAIFSVVFSGAVWTILKLTLGLRVSPEEEWEGLDIGEHGMEAYSGFVKESDALVGNRSGSFGNADVYRSEL